MRVGILALQGDVREHVHILRKLNAEPVLVKLPEHLTHLDALIIPGGESTVIGMLMKKYGIDKAIKEKHKQGMPIYGTCAGAIVLSKDIMGSRQPRLGLVDISIKRNEYGRQIDSFEADLSIRGIGDLKGIFIRAPLIKKFYNGAEILAEYNLYPVMVKQDNLLITTFHPELANDPRIHQYFLEMVSKSKVSDDAQEDIGESQIL
jgi:pyridoxal 5'-phosphate synthase pdxT subunit